MSLTAEATTLAVIEICDSPISVWLDIVGVLSAWMAADVIDFVVCLHVSVECAECAPRLSAPSQDEAKSVSVELSVAVGV